MSNTFTTESSSQKSKLKIIFWTALIAGTLDILSAIINTYIRAGVGPDRVFKFIASGVFGDSAFSGGAGMVIAGIIFHYFIASTWTVLFFTIYPKLGIKNLNKYLVGFLYGVLVWLIMNLIVVPLSNTPHITFTVKGVLLGGAFLIFFIGTPISLIYHKYYLSKSIN